MEYFTLEHATHMLSNEWLVKVDAERSKPYLFVGELNHHLGSHIPTNKQPHVEVRSYV
jgi:hypothetical protein